ncbi:unnamed protein product [Schistosoma haematobium]|nr:unnamed protein product [Schistosoma haematobium]
MVGSMSTNYTTTNKTTVGNVCITHNGNWNNEKPYEVKSRALCPKMQNIRKVGFQTTRDDTHRAPSSIVNIKDKMSKTGSSGSRVNHKRTHDQPISIKTFHYILRNTQRKWRSGKKSLDKFSKSVRDGSGHGNVQRQHNGRIPRY